MTLDGEDVYLLLQKPIAVRIYCVKTLWLCDGDMIVPYTDNGPIFLMSPMHPSEFLASSRTKCQPDVAEPC
jgi:hypothetical protein